MLQAIEGIYRNGKVELLEQPIASEGMRVIVTFLDSSAEPVESSVGSTSLIVLEDQGIGIEQAAALR